MTIDLNKNGKDDIDELLEDMHDKFDKLSENADAAVKEFVADNIAPLEDAVGIDINGDGEIGSGGAKE